MGKTTLCKSLVERLNRFEKPHIYRHFSRLPDKFDRYFGYDEAAMTHSVQDRFHMSEPIYAFVRQDLTPLDQWTYRMVEANLRLCGAYIVVLYFADPILIQDRWREGEMYNVEQVQSANTAFSSMCNVGDWRGYQSSVDWASCFDREHQFLSEVETAALCEAYMEHLARYEDLLEKRRDRWPRTLGG